MEVFQYVVKPAGMFPLGSFKDRHLAEDFIAYMREVKGYQSPMAVQDQQERIDAMERRLEALRKLCTLCVSIEEKNGPDSGVRRIP